MPDSDRPVLVREFLDSPETGPGVRVMGKSSIAPSDFSNQAVLRAWMAKARPDLLDAALSNPEDKSFVNWMAWRLAGGDTLPG